MKIRDRYDSALGDEQLCAQVFWEIFVNQCCYPWVDSTEALTDTAFHPSAGSPGRFQDAVRQGIAVAAPKAGPLLARSRGARCAAV